MRAAQEKEPRFDTYARPYVSLTFTTYTICNTLSATLTLFLGFGLVTDKILAFVNSFVEGFHGLLTTRTGGHLDECETFRFPRERILHQIELYDFSKLGE